MEIIFNLGPFYINFLDMGEVKFDFPCLKPHLEELQFMLWRYGLSYGKDSLQTPLKGHTTDFFTEDVKYVRFFI